MATDEGQLPPRVHAAACCLADLDLASRDDLVASVKALRMAIAEVGPGETGVADLVRATDGLEAAHDADPQQRETAVRAVAMALDRLMTLLAGEEEDDPVPRTTAPHDAEPDGEAFVLIPETADREMLGEWVSESRELLERCEESLLQLELDPADAESINTIFRGFHTIKGTGACLGLDGISRFAHCAETLLSRVREGELSFCGSVADLALRSRDALVQMTEAVAGATRGEPPPSFEDLAELRRALLSPDDYREPSKITAPGATASVPRAEKMAAPRTTDDATDSVRVRTDRLDRLVDMVGELVVSHSMVAEEVNQLGSHHQELARRVHAATKIVRELRDLGLSLRMVPMRGVFRKLQRAVRDATQRTGKSVEFVTEGGSTEIDRNMVDLLADPLIHMVRNAVDHGIESAHDRLASGKQAQGTLRLSALRTGGSVVLRLEDDGRGLDRATILRRAVERGLVTPGSEPADSVVYELLFQPGFSTAEKVTDISGRGVGLDVVRRGIEALHGRVEIASSPGEGTVFSIKLPLTMAIADGMQVRCGDQRFIVPTTSIRMSLQPKAPLQTVQGRGELLQQSDDLLPVFRLGRLFGIRDAVDDPAEGLLVVLDDGEKRFALLVDELMAQQQVVVKPLDPSVGKVDGVSGAAVLGDGSVALILEPGELADLGRHDKLPVAVA